jgi:RNA 3'-terminal phosphate cyclase-like protein
LLYFDSSPGYGISLVAETTTGCLISADMAVSDRKADEMEEEIDEKPNLMSPEELGEKAASMLLEEIEQGGVVDSTHQVSFLVPMSLYQTVKWSPI